MDNIENSPCSKGDQSTNLCFGCNSPILDHFLLTVSSDTHFHLDCMKCSECGESLDETKTCFLKEDKLLCKWDFARLFGARCGLCNCNFNLDELVMKTPGSIYHLDCFRCVVCSRVIGKGEQFSNVNNRIFCHVDHDLEINKLSTTTTNDHGENCANNFNEKKNLAEQNNNSISTTRATHAGRSSSSSASNNNNNSSNPLKTETKTTRVRTVLNERQLHTLRTCYAVNPRPDALMKEQLVEMTGLNPRVIRVWFQNKRCKDKKRNIIFKQLRQQDHDGVVDSVDPWLTNKGVPMVASSPVCHNSSASSSMLTPIEIQPHPVAAWKMEFSNNTCVNGDNAHQKLQHYSSPIYHDGVMDQPNHLPHFSLPHLQADHHLFGHHHDDSNMEDDDTVVSLDDQTCVLNHETKDSLGRGKRFGRMNNSPNPVFTSNDLKTPAGKYKIVSKMSPERNCFHPGNLHAQDSKCSYSSESNF